MDSLTAAILKNFQESLLGPLVEHLQRLSTLPNEQRKADPALVQVLDESMEVLQALRQWSSPIPPKTAELSTADELRQDQQLVADFLHHADDLMERMGIDLGMLNKHVNDERAIEEIFRAMHTLKGVAGMFGFQPIALVAHHTETALSVLKERAQPISPAQVQKFYLVHDRICSMLDEIREGGPPRVDPHEIVTQLSGPTHPVPDDSLPLGELKHEGTHTEDSHKIDATRLDKLMSLLADLSADKSRLRDLEAKIKANDPRSHAKLRMAETMHLFDRHMDDLQALLVQTRLIPVVHVFKKCQRVAREITRETGKPINLFMVGEETRLDRTIAERLTEPLVHLLRNACDHGIESADKRSDSGKPQSGRVTICAERQGNAVIIKVSDDGAGLDLRKIEAAARGKGLLTEGSSLTRREIENLIFHPGLSTADKITKISGRGIGMDVVKARVEEFDGSITIESEPGCGTTFVLRLPVTLAVQTSLLVEAGDQTFAVPVASLQHSMRVTPHQIQRLHNRDSLHHGDQMIPVARLSDILQSREEADRKPLAGQQSGPVYALILQQGERRFGLVVDRLRSHEDIVVKPLSPLLGRTQFISGGAVLRDGKIAMMIDPQAIEEVVQTSMHPRKAI